MSSRSFNPQFKHKTGFPLWGERRHKTNEEGKETDGKRQRIQSSFSLSLSDLFQAMPLTVWKVKPQSHIYDNGGLYKWEGNKHDIFITTLFTWVHYIADSIAGGLG